MHWLVVFLGLFLLFALLRIPVAVSMSIATLITMLGAGVNFGVTGLAVFNGLNSFTFLAIPAFIIAGDIMGVTGISNRLLNWVDAFVGRLRGSTGATAIVCSLLFGTLTGSSLATCTAIGTMMIPEMEKRGYPRPYSGALIAASGFLGILIPPSIPGIMFSMMSGTNLLAVWSVTIVPGILIAIGYIVINYFRFGRKETKTTEPFRFGPYLVNIAKQTWSALPAILMPLIIFYGIYGGVLRPAYRLGVPSPCAQALARKEAAQSYQRFCNLNLQHYAYHRLVCNYRQDDYPDGNSAAGDECADDGYRFENRFSHSCEYYASCRRYVHGNEQRHSAAWSHSDSCCKRLWRQHAAFCIYHAAQYGNRYDHSSYGWQSVCRRPFGRLQH